MICMTDRHSSRERVVKRAVISMQPQSATAAGVAPPSLPTSPPGQTSSPLSSRLMHLKEASPFSPLSKSKVIILGDTGAGKTSLLKRMLDKEFKPNAKSTVGVDFVSKTVHKKGKPMRLQIWDTAGQERYATLIPGYLKNVKIVVIVFDLTREDGLKSVDKWMEVVRGCKAMDAPNIILVGNKCDRASERKVSEEEGKIKSEEIKAVFYQETSALTGDRSQDLLSMMINTIEPTGFDDKWGGSGGDGTRPVDRQEGCVASVGKWCVCRIG